MAELFLTTFSIVNNKQIEMSLVKNFKEQKIIIMQLIFYQPEKKADAAQNDPCTNLNCYIQLDKQQIKFQQSWPVTTILK